MGILPDEWNLASTVPVHKKDKENMRNYRPISLLCVVSKVLERCIYNRIFYHVSPFLSNTQHGFRKGRSTVTQVVSVLHKISSALDEGFLTDIIYLDYNKAFDSVHHKLLLKKLHLYGIRGSLLEWMTDYLLHRRQKTTIQRSHSCSASVPSGALQGSILVPLLFILYENDLPSVVNSQKTKLAIRVVPCGVCVCGV